MGLMSTLKEQPPQSLTRKLLPWTMYAFASIFLLRLYFNAVPSTPPPPYELSQSGLALVSSSFSLSSPAPYLQEGACTPRILRIVIKFPFFIAKFLHSCHRETRVSFSVLKTPRSSKIWGNF